ncbi:MAG TPA: AMP-binding protein, partial [Beutenbergiaceae bacterium]|nr:AMP-binding protein [Beutenbergiaceae bacterium]
MIVERSMVIGGVVLQTTGWTESVAPMDLTTMFDSTARKFPNKAALIFNDTQATYAELAQASKKSAQALKDAGIAPGDRVGVMTYNTPGFVVAALGIWR